MPGPLRNPKHEKLAQELAGGSADADAHEAAGYKRDDGNASRMCHRADVQARVQELRDKVQACIQGDPLPAANVADAVAVEKLVIDRQWVLDRLAKNVRQCIGEEAVTKIIRIGKSKKTMEVTVTERDPAAANRALELLGKESGMFVDRSENVNKNFGISDKPVTPEEWEKISAEPAPAPTPPPQQAEIDRTKH